MKLLTIIIAYIVLVNNSIAQATATQQLYNNCGLSGKLAYNIFEKALQGQQKMQLKNDSIITIIDFVQHSKQKRLFVINLNSKKIIFNTQVAHGLMSDSSGYARYFSNKSSSKKSSLGFYKTLSTTISPNHGYALLLQGLEIGINNNALAREIIMHKAWYVNESFIKNNGYVGRSWGCPALNETLYKSIIDYIKNGSCLFIYANNNDYLNSSKFLN